MSEALGPLLPKRGTFPELPDRESDDDNAGELDCVLRAATGAGAWPPIAREDDRSLSMLASTSLLLESNRSATGSLDSAKRFSSSSVTGMLSSLDMKSTAFFSCTCSTRPLSRSAAARCASRAAAATRSSSAFCFVFFVIKNSFLCSSAYSGLFL